MIYRSKPTRHIEAMQVPPKWDGEDPPLEIANFALWLGVGGPWKMIAGSYIEVTTINGNVARAQPGDFIIKEPDGVHHYPCTAEIFNARYELADAD